MTRCAPRTSLLGLSEAETATELGVSLGTVKSTASRGLARLRELLAEPPDATPSTSGRSGR